MVIGYRRGKPDGMEDYRDGRKYTKIFCPCTYKFMSALCHNKRTASDACGPQNTSSATVFKIIKVRTGEPRETVVTASTLFGKSATSAMSTSRHSLAASVDITKLQQKYVQG